MTWKVKVTASSSLRDSCPGVFISYSYNSRSVYLDCYEQSDNMHVYHILILLVMAILVTSLVKKQN